MEKESNRLCIDEPLTKKCDDEIESILPLVLIFLSQFVLGVGNTLYYALGQTYLDDGVTKKKNTPILLAYVSFKCFSKILIISKINVSKNIFDIFKNLS